MARSWAQLLGDADARRRERRGAARASSVACATRSANRAARSPSSCRSLRSIPADDASWERLEEALIYADVGVRATAELIRRLEARQDLTELNGALAEEIAALFGEPPTLDVHHAPAVILVVGVNGTGKTTTIGKLAQKLREHGRTVTLGAADTFRAAAEEQLEIWARARRREVRRRRARRRSRRGRLRRGRLRHRRRDRRHRRPPAHADEPDGRAREGAARDRGPARRRAARDAARRRRDDRAERPAAGAHLQRGRRRDRRRA